MKVTMTEMAVMTEIGINEKADSYDGGNEADDNPDYIAMKKIKIKLIFRTFPSQHYIR